MSADLRKVVVDTLRNMNFDVDSVTDETLLGDGGLELESLSMAELVVHLDPFGISFSDEEMEKLGGMTLGEFTEEAGSRAAGN